MSSSSSSSSEDDANQYADLMAAIEDAEQASEVEPEEEEEEDGAAMEESSSSSSSSSEEEEEEEEEEDEKEASPSPPPPPVKKRKRAAPKKAKKEKKLRKKVKTTTATPKKVKESEKKPRKQAVKAQGVVTLPLCVPNAGRFTRIKQRNPAAAPRNEDDDKPINQREHRNRALREQEGILSSLAQTERAMKSALDTLIESPLIAALLTGPPKGDRRWCLSNNAKMFALMHTEAFLGELAAKSHQCRAIRVRAKAGTEKNAHGMLYKEDVENAMMLIREFRDSGSRTFI